MPAADDVSLPFPDSTAADEKAGAVPAYQDTVPCDENGAKARQSVAHMDELKAQEGIFLQMLLSLHYRSQLLAPCSCGKESQLRKSTAVAIGHNGHRCPEAGPSRTFTLVDSNGIHATSVTFCRCATPDGPRGEPEFQQLLRAGIFPGSVKEPKTGYTLGVLEFWRQLRSQGKGSAYNFVLVLQRMADPFFAGSVPDIYINFLAITRFHEHLDIIMRRGHAHGLDDPLPGEADRPYPNRPIGFLGVLCAACPEKGVNMPLVVKVKRYLRHLESQNRTIDGNFKANLFFKRDDGSDIALTDGNMYFPNQMEFERIAREYEVPCKAHIGSIRHQGSVKYGNTAVSGVIACACDHAVVGSFVDMLNGEATTREFEAHQLPTSRSRVSHPNKFQLRQLVFIRRELGQAGNHAFSGGGVAAHAASGGGRPDPSGSYINGHGADCQAFWQAVYFACRAHFHGETAEVVWAFLNALGSSTRQMTGPARHDIMNYVIDAWNTWKVLRQAELLAAERLDALRLFELHMAVVEDLSRQHATEVTVWAKMSVYQHETTKVLTVESTLAAMVAEEREKMRRIAGRGAGPPLVEWIHDGMSIERQQTFVIALLKSHREHPLQETWETITKLRDSLNLDLKKFRERQREIYPRLKLSALDVDEPELTAIQLPSYRMKHGQRKNDEDSELREAETKLRCSEANSGILAVRAASLALSAVKKARDLDYRGQAGITRSQRNLQKADLMKVFEITMYNRARAALVHLGHMGKNDEEPYPPMDQRDTRRKETHLHRAKGDSRLFDGTAWYLQSGVTISHAVVTSTLAADNREEDSEDEPQLLAGTQTLKRAGFTRSQRPPKRLRDIAPDDVVVESSASEAEDSDLDMSPSKQGKQQRGKQKGKQKAKEKAKKKKPDGWIWLERVTRGQNLGDDTKLAEYKRESDRVQWFRAEAEMYRWLEQYERKHAELMRVIERYRRDGVVWTGLADREEQQKGGVNGASTFARMQATMYHRLEHNAKVIFEKADSGAHHDWVKATTFDELVTKIDGWRDVVFKWMDDLVFSCSQPAGDQHLPARRSLGHPRVPPVLGYRVGGVVVLVVVAQPPSAHFSGTSFFRDLRASDNRDNWTDGRAAFFAVDPVNAVSLEAIKSVMVEVRLDSTNTITCEDVPARAVSATAVIASSINTRGSFLVTGAQDSWRSTSCTSRSSPRALQCARSGVRSAHAALRGLRRGRDQGLRRVTRRAARPFETKDRVGRGARVSLGSSESDCADDDAGGWICAEERDLDEGKGGGNGDGEEREGEVQGGSSARRVWVGGESAGSSGA
ncbi:hypothetical protein B0H11DRAFT_1902570 [Mycena galericulata]|nr:hypothetical protein B0H11DRAFT_1902570 [Mycena galericulata]